MGCPVWGNEQHQRSGGQMRFGDHCPSHWCVAGLLCAVAASVVAVAGCSGNSSALTTTSPASTSAYQQPSASSLPDAAKQNAIAAYLGMWQDFAAAGTNSDWQSAQLGRFATDPALSNMHKALFADHTNGLVTKGNPVLNPAVDSIDSTTNPSKITIKDCGDSTHWLKYRASDGQLADNTPGGRQLIYANVQKQSDGSWKVSDYAVHDVGTC